MLCWLAPAFFVQLDELIRAGDAGLVFQFLIAGRPHLVIGLGGEMSDPLDRNGPRFPWTRGDCVVVIEGEANGTLLPVNSP